LASLTRLRRSAAPPPAWQPLELAGSSPVSRRLRERIHELAVDPGPVLIVAPRGYDAAAIASGLHAAAGRRGAFVPLDCVEADGARLEAALFATPPPRRGQAGALEAVGPGSALALARDGTLVLTSAADMGMSTQARLSRLLREGAVRINGGTRPTSLTVQVVLAADTSLDADVRDGRFRSDLYRRLAGRRLDIPPLRDRRTDIETIARALMDRAAREAAVPPRGFTQAALGLLEALPWDGNVGELDAVVRRLLSASETAPIRVEDVIAELDPRKVATVGVPRTNLRDARRQFEREYIAAVLEQTGWRMGPAARVLGIERTNLYRKARQLGIARAKVTP